MAPSQARVKTTEVGNQTSLFQRFSRAVTHDVINAIIHPSTWLREPEEPNASSSDASGSSHNDDAAQTEAQPSVPPPPKDPNDPINWSSKHKAITYTTVCLFSFMANVNASNFTVAVLPLTQSFHITTTQATALTALNVLMFGLGNLIWVPLMRLWGKRPVYLISMALLAATNAWGTFAKSYSSLLASRMLSGIGAAAADATVPSLVADLWGSGSRAEILSAFHFALASGIFLGPLINAWVVQNHGWRWSPAWMAFAFTFLLVLSFFGISETEYRHERPVPVESFEPQRARWYHWLSLTVGKERRPGRTPRKVLSQTLKDIMIMTSYPQIIWAAMLVGVIIGWTIIIQITAGQVFTRPARLGGAYHWNIGRVGIFHISGWLGAILGGGLGGRLADVIARRRSTSQNLPLTRTCQYRLSTLFIFAAFCPVGLLVYGFCLDRKTWWIGPGFGYAMHSFGFAAISNVAVTYVVDCFTPVAGEALVSLFIIRNVIGVVCSFYCNPWIAQDGMPTAFGIMAGLEWFFLFVALLFLLRHERILKYAYSYGPAKRIALDMDEPDEDFEMQSLATGSRA